MQSHWKKTTPKHQKHTRKQKMEKFVEWLADEVFLAAIVGGGII